MTKAPGIAGAFGALAQHPLFQRGRNSFELGLQGAADAVDGSDDHDRDTGGNQAIFDGGGAGLVLQETRNQVLHQVNSMYTWLVKTNIRSHRRSQHPATMA